MKRIRWRERVFLLSGLLVPLLSGLAYASVDVIASFGSLVRAASDVVVVTAQDQHAEWADGRIYTFSHLHVDEPVAGSLHGGDDVWVRTLGGIVGNIGQSVEGESVFVPGGSSFVFLHKGDAGLFSVVGRAQGQFPVVAMPDGSRKVMRSAAVGGLVPAHAAPEASDVRLETPARDLLHGLSVSGAHETVAKAWAKLHSSK